MEREKKIRALALALMAAVLLLAGVVIGRNLPQESIVKASAKRAAGSGYAVSESAALDSAATLSSSANGAAGETRKIVRTAQLDVEVDDIDAAMAAVKAQAEAAGGEITSSWVSGRPGEGRYASMEISVPSGEMDAFLGGAGGLGEVTYSYSQQTDMTSQYIDNASRLESARAQKQRLDELYAQAQDMADIVAITDALFEVQQEIDSLTGANASIDSRADNAQVYIAFTEAAAEDEEAPFFARLKSSLADGFAAIGAFFTSLALFAAWALPWLALIAALLFAVRLAARIVKKK